MKSLLDEVPPLPAVLLHRHIWVRPCRFHVNQASCHYIVTCTIDLGYGRLTFREAISAYDLCRRETHNFDQFKKEIGQWVREATIRIRNRILDAYETHTPRSTT